MALTAAQTTAAVKLGVAAFGAPISTYTTVFEAVLNSAAPFGGSIENTYTAFLTLVPPYENVTDAAFAATFVETLLGDSVTAEAKAAGVTLVETLLASPGATRGSVAVAVIDALAGVPNDDATFGAASARLENRVVVAEYYTTTYGGTETDVAVLQTIIAGVTATTDVSAPASIIDGALNPVTNFTLTTGVDVLAPTATDVALKTGAGNDKVSGVVSSLSSEGTLQATDSIDGDAGNDTLALDLKASFTGFTGTGGVKNVETIALTNAGTIDRTFNTKGIVGATTYNLKATGAAISLTDMVAAGGTVNVEGQTKGAVSLGFAAAALAGTADALTLGLNGVGTVEVKDAAGAVTTAEAALAVTTTAGLETLAVMAMGANVVDLAGSNAGKITVAGAGSLKVTAANAAVTSFDASAATGAVTADLTAAGPGALTAVKGGAGDDSFTVDASDLAANATLAGGAGTNTLILNGAGGTLQPVMSGFKTLGLKGVTADLTISGKNATDLDTISLSKNALTAATTLTIANLAATGLTVASTGAQAAATVTLTSAADFTYTTGADAASSKAKTADAVATIVNATEATSATINIGAYTNQTGTINVGKATGVTLNVASGKDAAGTTEVTEFNAVLNADKATALMVNATGKLGLNTQLNAGAATSVQLTATAGGTADVNAAKATNVTITAGEALTVTGSDFAAAEQVTIAANKGVVTGTAVNLAKVNTLTLSGATATSGVILGNLGTAAQEYAVNVTASGLKGGLSLGDVATKADINIDLNGMTGTSGVGTLAGASVTVNANGALDTVTTGAITAKTAVTYNGSELKANTATINAEGTSTALTAVLNGGIADDSYTVNSVASSTSTTVSGDVGIGTNSVKIDGALANSGTFTLNASGLTGSGTTTITLIGSTAVKNTITGSAIADTITGGNLVDTINGGAGNDTITGGTGADVLTGGAGNDTFKFAAGDSGVPSATVFDTITDFATGDIIDFGTALTFEAAAGAAAVGVANITAAGLATFIAADDTVAERIVAVEAAMAAGTLSAGDSAVWQQGADAYLFISDALAGVGANDVLIKLTGVTVNTGLTISGGGDITAIA